MYEWATVLGYLGDFLKAAQIALEITVFAFILSVILGVVAALALNSGSRLLRLVGNVYVEAIRNTPVLLQIFVVFFALPSVGIVFNAVTAGTIALGVNVGAYLAVVFRAGMSSVPRGQLEAAEILGLDGRAVFLSVVIPQAVRNVYPAVINNLIQILLGTSLLSTIAVEEISGTAITVNSRTLIFLPVFTLALVLYLVLSNLLTYAGAVVGKKVFKPPLVIPHTTLKSMLSHRRKVRELREMSA